MSYHQCVWEEQFEPQVQKKTLWYFNHHSVCSVGLELSEVLPLITGVFKPSACQSLVTLKKNLNPLWKYLWCSSLSRLVRCFFLVGLSFDWVTWFEGRGERVLMIGMNKGTYWAAR